MAKQGEEASLRVVRSADPGKKKRGNRKNKKKQAGKKNKKAGKRKAGKKNKKRSSKTSKKQGKRKQKQGKGKKGKRKGAKKGKRSSKKQAGKGKFRQSTTTCAVNSTCLKNAVTYIKILDNQVDNFFSQKKRMERQNGTGKSKSGKQKVFLDALSTLVDFTGGNRDGF